MRLYWTKPELFEIDVEVETVNGCDVVVDPAIFHPNEGGQPADKGTIGPATVCSVEIRDGRIVHTLDRPLSDGKYIARVDKEHRLYTASQHTAQHILSGIAEKQFSLQTTGVHIGLDTCTVDFDKRIDWDTATAIECRAMDVVTLDLPVETAFNESDVRIRGDSKTIESDMIRVVKIGDYDKSACCGAHLKSTGQIGLIRILSLENKKEGTRVSFLAGRKALEYAQSEASVLRELRKAAGCATPELPAAFEKALKHSMELAKEVNRLWTLWLPGFVETAKIIEIEGEKVGVHLSEVPQKFSAKLAAMIAQSIDGAGIVVNERKIAVSSCRISAKEILDRIIAAVGGKGGGSPTTANGGLENDITFDQIQMILQENS
ncbi:MAG: hypothetical protein JXM79_17105 [Sedimentisphaerales bacterium]|nr:hypothetical protein [Sedimentisphaerales bacterium]